MDWKSYLEKRFQETKETTMYGDPAFYITLKSKRLLEVIHEKHGKFPFYSIIYHCTKEEFRQGMYNSRLGVIQIYVGADLKELAGELEKLLSEYHEEVKL